MNQPDVRVVAHARPQNPSNIVSGAFDKSSKTSTRSQARKMGRAHKRRGQFWLLILYLITIIGSMVAAGIYLLS